MTTMLILLAALVAPSAGPAAAIEFRNGHWLVDNDFRTMTVYSVEGRFTMERPVRVDSVVDLAGGWALPPFGDAHTHMIGDARDFAREIARYMSEGVLYMKNTNSTPRRSLDGRALVNRPGSIDVTYSFGGLTSPGGHPAFIYNFIIRDGQWPGWTTADLDGQAYHALRDSADFAGRWAAIMEPRPDFLKLYLEGSERHGTELPGPRGLDPALVPVIVRYARAAGLHTTAHVTSVHDVRVAVHAGVDELAHLPLERLTDDDVALLAAHGIRVVTTVLSHRPGGRGAAMEAVHADNLRRLHAAGVTIAIGTDNDDSPVFTEADAVCRLGILDNAALLKIWTEGTAAAIHPERRIGRIEEGYEASFVLLEENPLEDFNAVRRVMLRVKQGDVLHGFAPREHDVPRTRTRCKAA